MGLVEGYLYSKAIMIACEKDCFQKERERAKGIVPLRSNLVGPYPGTHQESLALSWGWGGVNDTQQGFGEPC